MTHTISSDRYRIGRNIHWNVFYSSFYFNKGMRLQIMLTLSLKYMMAVIGIQVIKLFLSWETRVLKFNIIGVRLTDVIIQDFSRRDVVAEKDVENVGVWYSPAVESHAVRAHITLDNNIHSLAGFQPAYQKRPLSCGLSIYDQLSTSSDEEFVENDNELVLSEGAVTSKKTGFNLEVDIFNNTKEAGIISYLSKRKVRFSGGGCFAQEGVTINFSKNFLFFLISRVFGKKGLIAAVALEDVITSFKSFSSGLTYSYNSLLKKKLLKKNDLLYKFNSLSNVLKKYKSLVSNPRLMVVVKKKYLIGPDNHYSELTGFFRLMKFVCATLKIIKKKSRGAQVGKLTKKIIFLYLKRYYFLFKSFFNIKLPRGVFLSLFKKKEKKPISRFFFNSARTPTGKLIHDSKEPTLKTNLFLFKPHAFEKGVSEDIRPTSRELAIYEKISSSQARNLIFGGGLQIIKNNFFVASEKKKEGVFVLRLLKKFFASKEFLLIGSANKKSIKKIKCKYRLKKKLSALNVDFKMFFYLFCRPFSKKFSFLNWVNEVTGSYLVPSSVTMEKKVNNWLVNNEGILDLQKTLSLIFNCEVRLNFFSAASVFSSNDSLTFLKTMSTSFKKVYKIRQVAPILKFGYFFSYLAFKFRSPDLITTFLADALERRRDHYTILGAFSRLLNLFKLSKFKLVGFRLGLYGRLNGRDRKFRYYITRGQAPALRVLDLKVDYAEEQCVGFLGVVHVHVWMYRF